MKSIIELRNFKLVKNNDHEIQSTLYFKNYSDLNIFRREIDGVKSFYSRTPYSLARKKTLTYKSIFLGLGLLFIVLGSFIFFTTLKYPAIPLFNNTFEILKQFTCGASLLIGLGSLLVCYSLRTESEIINHMVRKSHRHLARCYARKKLQHKIHSLFLFGENYRKYLFLKQHHMDSKHHIFILKEKTQELMAHILNAPHLNVSKKEILCNQAILELEEKLTDLINEFDSFNLIVFESL